MATTFKTLNSANDVTSTRTLLHEAIPLTGTIASGTYTDENIKTYSHGMFESVYDYPYLSSSANHIFDITLGFDESSAMSGSTGASQGIQIHPDAITYVPSGVIDGNGGRVLSYLHKAIKPVNQLRMVEDSLLALSKRNDQIHSFVNEEVSRVNENLKETIKYLGERLTNNALVTQQCMVE